MAVRAILQWSQKHNEEEGKHFPIMGIGYGMLAMLKSQMKHDISLVETLPGGKKQINLVHDPSHTYLFDSYEKKDLEIALDKIRFFTQLEVGITNEQFITKEDTLSTLFISVATIDDQSKTNANEEMLAAIEGTVYPWFGFG